VVVNDGSTDDTLERLRETFDLRQVPRPNPPFLDHAPVRGVYVPSSAISLVVIDKDNGGGKADSLNAGINFARYPIVACIDADSILEQDALVKTAMPFIDDPTTTIGSGGLVRIANGCRIDRGRVVEARLPKNSLAMFQVVEYLRAFFGSRPGWSSVNGLLIVSGAFGLFSREAVIEAGGYKTGSLGEDIELVVSLHRTMRKRRRPYRIVYVPDPVCWTEAPESLRALRSQRRRWQRGSIDTVVGFRSMIFDPRYRAVGLLALPTLLLFEVLGPIFELAGYIVVVVAVFLGTIDWHLFALFIFVSITYALVLSLGAIALEDAARSRHEGWDRLGKVLLYAVFEHVGFRQLTLAWRLEGLLKAAGSRKWEAMPRRGLSEPAA
jgi:cellulose synthase/poly-beta-1,6-N-acetylglucosamine synthase-like glycosyltransferase